MLIHVPSIPGLLATFILKKYMLNFVKKDFSVPTEITVWYQYLVCVQCTMFIDLHVLNHSWVSNDDNLIMVIDVLLDLVCILMRTSTSVFIWEIDAWYFFVSLSLSDLGI